MLADLHPELHIVKWDGGGRTASRPFNVSASAETGTVTVTPRRALIRSALNHYETMHKKSVSSASRFV